MSEFKLSCSICLSTVLCKSLSSALYLDTENIRERQETAGPIFRYLHALVFYSPYNTALLLPTIMIVLNHVNIVKGLQNKFSLNSIAAVNIHFLTSTMPSHCIC